jgi:predicted enzyme related to lactoylglutathione lyase
MAYLRCGDSANIELFAYAGDDEGGCIRRPSQVGAFHLAFQIDDVSAAAERLRERGVELLEGPTYVERGGLAGLTWIYLRSPWGQVIELYGSEQLGYEAGTQERLYRPG